MITAAIIAVAQRSGGANSAGLEARNHEPAPRPAGVDQLLGRKARPGAQVCEVPLRGARPNADPRCCLGHGPPRGDEGLEYVDLAGGRVRGSNPRR